MLKFRSSLAQNKLLSLGTVHLFLYSSYSASYNVLVKEINASNLKNLIHAVDLKSTTTDDINK